MRGVWRGEGERASERALGAGLLSELNHGRDSALKVSFNRPRPSLTRPGCHGGCNNFFLKGASSMLCQKNGRLGRVQGGLLVQVLDRQRAQKAAEDAAKKAALAARIFVREKLHLHFLIFVLCVCMQQGRHIAHKFESGWEVGVISLIKAFDKKDPHAGKFSVKYKDDPNWWTHSLLREGYGKRQALGSAGAPELIAVTMSSNYWTVYKFFAS